MSGGAAATPPHDPAARVTCVARPGRPRSDHRTGGPMRHSLRPRHRPAARPVLALQTLEGREVPAGNVVATLSPFGQLTLVGDDAGNAITVRVTGTSVTVTGNAGTTVNGRASVTAAAAVGSVQAAMNADDDV